MIAADQKTPAAPTPVPAAALRAIPAWPADSVPSRDEADRAVRAVLANAAGALDPALAARVAAEVTDLERAAFSGAADETTEVLRAAAALRWRLGAAVLTAPERGAVDEPAVAELLRDADAVLGALQTTFENGAPALVETAGSIRRSLVSDAISVNNAVQRLTAPEPEVQAPAGPKAPETRVLSVVSGDAPVAEPRRRGGMGLWVLLALSVVGAGSWHVKTYFNRPRLTAPPVEGSPVGTTATPERSGRSMLMTSDGKPLAAGDLERLRAAQKAKGKRVSEFARGVYVIEPEEAPGQRSTP